MKAKRVSSFFLAVLMALSVLSINAFAAPGDSSSDPITDTSDHVNFPPYDQPGSVGVVKTAKWVHDAQEGDNTYAMVTMNINGVPKAGGVDVVLVLDTSGSMGGENGALGSPCLDSSHWQTFSITKEVRYIVFYDNNTDPRATGRITGDVTLNVEAHFNEDGTYNLVNVWVDPDTLVKTGPGGKTVTHYSANTSFLYAFTADEVSDPDIVADSNSHNIRTWLGSSAAFGGPTYSAGGRTITIVGEKIGSLLNAYTGSDCYFRLDVSKLASHAFVDEFFKPVYFQDENGNQIPVDNNNRISVVTFSDTANAVNGGHFYGSDEQADLKAALSAMDAEGDTSYVQPLNAAGDLLSNRTDTNRPSYVVFMSDGEPHLAQGTADTPAQISAAVASLGQHATGIYSVGVNLKNANALSIIGSVVKAPGVNRNVLDANISDLVSIFQDIAYQTAAAGTNAVITDIIGKQFTLVPDSAEHPWTLTIGGNVIADKRTVSGSGDTITWNLGNIPRQASLSYYVKIKDNTPEGFVYSTNEEATINYQNYQDKWCEKEFPVPGLPYPGGSIRIIHYLVNDNGRAVSPGGIPLADEGRDSILSSGVVFKDEFYEDNGKKILTIGQLYQDTEDDYTYQNIEMVHTNMRKVDVNGNAELLNGKTWQVTLVDLQDSYTILVGYSARLPITVNHKYGDLPVETETTTQSMNTPVNVTPKAKAGYDVTDVKIDVDMLVGGTHNLVADAVTRAVTGTMPIGKVVIDYTYSGEPTDYTVEYYLDGTGTGNKMSETYTGTGTVGEVITLTDEIINKYKPAGYNSGRIFDAPTDNKLVFDASNNVWKVVYDSRVNNIKYTVEYYLDDTDPGSKMSETYTGYGTFGEVITLTDEVINKYQPIGYNSGHVFSTPTDAKLVLDESKNVWKVVYDSPVQNIKYTVEYYLGGTRPEDKMNVPDFMGTGHFGQVITLDQGTIDLRKPDGYNSGRIFSAPTDNKLVLNESQNVWKVVYDSPVQNIKYTVEYYLDNTDPGSKMSNEFTDTGHFGQVITLDQGTIDLYKPDGYNSGRIFSAPTDNKLVLDESANVWKVVYDSRMTNIKYTVEYYVDGEADTDKIAGADYVAYGTFGEVITLTDLIINANRPTGYDDGRIFSAPTDNKLVLNESLNVWKVVYDQKVPVDYTVIYYRGQIHSSRELGREPGSGFVGEAIPADLTLYAPPGYETPGKRSGATVITTDPAANVVNVLYDTMYLIPYTVEYYYDSLANTPFRVEDDHLGYYGDFIAVELERYARPGDDVPATRTGPMTVGVVAADNVVKVLYKGSSNLDYTVEYYKDSIAQYNYLNGYTGTGTYGEYIAVDATAFAPEGYMTPGTRYGSETIGRGTNLVRIVYETRNNYKYMVEYYYDQIDTAHFITELEYYGRFNDPIIPNRFLFAPNGYVTPGKVSGATRVSTVEADNITRVLYDEKELYSYTVNYYKDRIHPSGFITSESGTAEYGTAIPYNSAHEPKGYAIPGNWYGPTHISSRNNIVNIVFDTKVSYEYTVYYYKDDVDTGEYLNEIVGYGNYGDAINPNTSMFAPAGYDVPGRIDARSATAISDDENLNKAYVVYDTKQSYAYTVEYYAGVSETDNVALGSTGGSAAFGAPIPVDLDYLRPTEGYEPGYAFFNAGGRITANAADNVVKVLYKPTTNIKYTVEYYLDGTGTGNKMSETYTGYGYFGEIITLDQGTIDLYKPVGYNSGRVFAEPTDSKLVLDESQNVWKVIYDSPVQNIKYTVEYYLDDTDPGSKMSSEFTDTGYFGQVITLDQGTIDMYKPDGYNSGRIFSAPTDNKLVLDESANVWKVVYDSRVTNIKYTVEYYLDSETNKMTDEFTGTGYFGEVITLDQTTIDLYKPTGYDSGRIFSAPTDNKLVLNESANVWKVVYDTKLSYNYTVEYYKGTDEVDVTNNEHIETIGGSAAFGSLIPVDLDAKRPTEGYEAGIIIFNDGGRITTDASANVVRVLYKPVSNIKYTVEYYLDREDNKMSAPDYVDYGYFGEVITLTDGIINANKPAGYGDGRIFSAPTDNKLVLNESDNVWKVVYDTKLLLNYEVRYHKELTPGGSTEPIGVYNGQGYVGDAITPNLTLHYPGDGYVTPGEISDPEKNPVITAPGPTIVNVLYKRLPPVDYTVEYWYKDLAGSEHYYDTYPDTAYIGETITLSEAELNRFKPDVEFWGGTTYKDGEQVSGPLTITSAGPNVIKVLYEPEVAMAEVSVKIYVRPFRGAAYDLDSTSSFSVQMEVGTYVVSRAQFYNRVPKLYTIDTVDPETFNVVTGTNVVEIHCTRGGARMMPIVETPAPVIENVLPDAGIIPNEQPGDLELPENQPNESVTQPDDLEVPQDPAIEQPAPEEGSSSNEPAADTDDTPEVMTE